MVLQSRVDKVNPSRSRALQVAVIAGLVTLSGIIALVSLLSRNAAVYQGRTATQWIRSAGLDNEDPASRAACSALQEIGVASLPAVLHELQARDYRNWLRPVYSTYHFFELSRLHRWQWDAPQVRRTQGAIALHGLAPMLGVPALTNLMSHPNRAVRLAAATAVCSADRTIALDVFVSAMKASRPEMRESGLEGFRVWSVLTGEGMRSVIQCASDANPKVRRAALGVMSYYSEAFLSLFPAETMSAVKKLAEDPDQQTRLETRQKAQAFAKGSRTKGSSR